MHFPGFSQKFSLQKQWFWFVVSNFSENYPRKSQCFQHWGIKTRGVLTTCFPEFSTLPAIFNTFFCVPAFFFTEFQHGHLVYTATVFQHRMRALLLFSRPIPAYISTVFQRGACVHSHCIPALLVCVFAKSSTPLLRTLLLYSSTAYVHFYLLMHFQHFVLHAFLLCSSIFCVHFYCVL